MTEWAAKRFWSAVTVAEEAEGLAILLDGKPVRTPARAPLLLPSRALAEVVAAEWAAQDGVIQPRSMPFTRIANAAIDTVAADPARVAGMLAEYGGTDLLCYRAEGPSALRARQAAAWDPVLDWAGRALGARLLTGQGIVHVAQPPESLARLSCLVAGLDPFRLAALHDLVTLSGSLLLALAVTRGHLTAAEAWPLSRIDEAWQEEQWGRDDEATEAAEAKRADFLRAERLLALLEG